MVRNGLHEFNCKKCGKLIKFSEILPHKKLCSPEEFKKHQSKAAKVSGKLIHKLYPNMAREQWEKYLSDLKGEKHPMYGKKHKPESKEKQRQAKLGKKMSPVANKNNSEAHKGSNNPMYGVHLIPSKETKDKQSKALKGKPKSKEWKKKIGDANKDKPHPWCKGELNYNWNNGSSFEPYCPKFNFKFKESVRERDGHVCQNCNKTQLEEGKRLTVHHVHYDKKNCYPDCVALCNSCNAKVNFNRDHYEELFTFVLWIRNLLYWRNE